MAQIRIASTTLQCGQNAIPVIHTELPMEGFNADDMYQYVSAFQAAVVAAHQQSGQLVYAYIELPQQMTKIPVASSMKSAAAAISLLVRQGMLCKELILCGRLNMFIRMMLAMFEKLGFVDAHHFDECEEALAYICELAS